MDKTTWILEAATFLQHEAAKNLREQLPVFLRLWGAETGLLKISWQAAIYPVLYGGVGSWGGWSEAATPAGNLWRMLIAYAPWAGAFNSRRNFPACLQRQSKQSGILEIGCFCLSACQSTPNGASSGSDFIRRKQSETEQKAAQYFCPFYPQSDKP